MEVRRPTLPWIAGPERPFMPFSRTKPRMSLSSFAQTTNTSAIGELEIHIFEPVRLYPPLTFFARVTIEPGSDPWLGSVRPKQPIHSPLASLGRYFFFVSGLPNSKIGSMTSDDCTLIIER